MIGQDYHRKHFPRIPRDSKVDIFDLVSACASVCLVLVLFTVMGWGIVKTKPEPVPLVISKEQLKLYTDQAIQHYTSVTMAEMTKRSK
jgi:hypothetical protein